MATDSNEKYITFKRSEFNRWWGQGSVGGTIHDVPAPEELFDAVVIRRQDLFASPCLFTYANMIALVADNIDDRRQAAELMRIADYFHDQAVLAADEGHKLPDV